MAQSKLSERTVEQVFDHLVRVNQPVEVVDVAETLGLHKTTAGRALRELVNREVAVRTVGKSVHGHPPYVYVLSGADLVLSEDTTAPTGNGNPYRPKTKRRAKRGSMDDLVRAGIKHWSPTGRGFTIYALHKHIGQGSYETVRRTVEALVSTGEIVRTDGYRKGARVYLPAATAPPAPVTAPAAPAVPANLTGLEALVKERVEILAVLSAGEKRLVEIDLALDKARELLA